VVRKRSSILMFVPVVVPPPPPPPVAVAVNVTGFPAMPAPDTVAVSVLAPAVPPSVQLPPLAIPRTDVSAHVPVAARPPVATANVTVAPPTPLPNWSAPFTDGSTASGVEMGPLWLLPALTATDAAGPGTAVAVMFTGGTPAVDALSVATPA